MSAILQALQLEKAYKNVRALESFSLVVEGGQIAVIIGVNGAGKTTLLRILAGLEKADKGDIVFNDYRQTDSSLRQISTLVFQRTTMFSRTVYENLAYGLKIRGKKDQEIKLKITEALKEVGLKDFEKRKAKKTSGGEQQRIALARAFLLEPKILLLDEPTANLDPNSARIIEKAILSMKRKDTIIIMATHNLGQAKRLADRVVHMHEGKIIENATPKDLFDNPLHETTKKFIRGELEF